MNIFELGANVSGEHLVITKFLDALGLGFGPGWPCWDNANSYEGSFDNIILLCRNYKETGIDLMYGWENGKRDKGQLLLGQWNSGRI